MAALLGDVLRGHVRPGGVIVHIGPGSLYEEIPYTEFDAKIVIAEPDLDVCAQLSHLARNPAFTLLRVGVAPTATQITYYHYNLPRLNGFREFHDLRSIFPGLRQLGARSIECIGVDKFVGNLPAPIASDDILIIDRVSSGADLLTEFAQQSALDRFSVVVTRAAGSEYLSPYRPKGDVGATFMADLGFDTVIYSDSDDPHFPVICYMKSLSSKQLRDVIRNEEFLSKKLKSVLEENSNLEAKVVTAARMQIAAEADLADLQAKYAQLFEEKTSLESLVTKVSSELSELAFPGGKQG